MSRHKNRNPVETEGTTEVPRTQADTNRTAEDNTAATQEVDMRDPNQIQERSRAAEEKKEKDIAQLRKDSDGEPKV